MSTHSSSTLAEPIVPPRDNTTSQAPNSTHPKSTPNALKAQEIDDKPTKANSKDLEASLETHLARTQPDRQNDHAEGKGAPKSGPNISTIHEIFFVALICSAQLLTQAGLGQAIAPLHIIGASFGTSNPGQLSWYAAAYSLTVGTFILIAGRYGDIFGHKLMFTVGFIWFGVWSAVAGFSVYSGQILFDICRAFQGIGPAILIPNAIAILGRTYPPSPRKNMIFSLFGATAPGGFVIGAVFSSLLSEFAWWPWAYWIMALVCLFFGIVSVWIIPGPMGHSRSPLPGELNVWGSITGVVGLVLLNFSWNQAPIVGWDRPYIYTLLIVGFLFLGAFFFIESRARHPLVPLKKLNGTTAFVLACIAAGWSSFGIWVFYVWQFVSELRHVSPLLSSAQFTPAAISGLCAALTTGFLLHRLGPATIMVISMLAFLVGTILIATAPVEQTYWAQGFVAICVMPWGMDMSFPAATIILSDTMPHEMQGVAASLVSTVVNYSISIGLGLAGTVEVHVNRGGENAEDLLKGYRGAWYMGIGLSGLGVLVGTAFVIKSTLHERKTAREK